MKIVVIGGVAAGMSAAARARRLDEHAEIVVLERSQYVSFANCGLPYHIGGAIKERDDLLLQTPQSLKASLNLDVRTGHEVTALDRARKSVRIRDLTTVNRYVAKLRIIPVSLTSNALKFTCHSARTWEVGKVDHGSIFDVSRPRSILGV